MEINHSCKLRHGVRFLRRAGLLSVLLVAALAVRVAAQGGVTVVNAASSTSDALAPESLAAAYGVFNTLQGQTYSASILPLPTTLGGVRVTVGGIDARLIMVSPSQINFVIPALAGDGPTPVVVTNADGTRVTGTINVQRAAPGIFTVRSNGQGAAAALVTSDGVNFLPTFNPDGSEREINAGTTANPNFLILYTTGLRNAPAANPNDANGVAEAVTATIQGVPVRVLYAGPSTFAGLDQVNLIIPPELAGLGLVRVRLMVAGRVSNVITLRLGGQPPPVRAEPIQAGAIVNGQLTIDDQVQADGSRTYFYDAYRLRTTAPDTTVALDVRSLQFDAAVAIYRQDTSGGLTLLAMDDQTGSLGNGQDEGTNALLLTVLREPGDYLILVTSAEGEPNAIGAYSLFVRTDVMQRLNFNTLTSNAAITATDLQTSAGDFLDAYWFNGSAGDVVQIRMSSTQFDSFLILNSNSGELIEFDDNSGGGPQGRDALLTARLRESGPYIIIATPFEPNRTGAYTLTLNRLNSAVGVEVDALARAPGRTWQQRRTPGESLFERFALRRLVSRE